MRLSVSVVFGVVFLGSQSLADARLPDFYDTLFLTSAEAGIGVLTRSDLPDQVGAVAFLLGAGMGLRFAGRHELEAEYRHDFLASGADALGGISGLTELGLIYRYSPVGFEGLFFQARAGWLSGSVSPYFSLSRAYFGGGAGYSFIAGPIVDLRPVVMLQGLPVVTTSGNQLWPLVSGELQAVFKTESVADFIASLLNGLKQH